MPKTISPTCAIGFCCALMLLPLVGVAQSAAPAVLLDLPSTDKFTQTASALAQALTDAGVTVRDHSTVGEDVRPVAVVLYSGGDDEAEQLKALQAFVRAGGGAVYLYGSTPRHIEPAKAFLDALGLGIEGVRTPRAQLQLTQHPIVSGVSDLPSASCNAILEGFDDGLLAAQGQAIVAGAARVGAGRVVVLPAVMLTAGGRRSPTAGQTLLLSNACLWASGILTRPLPPPPDATGGATTRPAAPSEVSAEGPLRPFVTPDRRPRPMRKTLVRERHAPNSDFRGAIVVDILAADDNWGLLAETLDKVLQATGVPVRYLDTESGRSPLVDAVESQPALLVIGSTRRFDLDEAVALAHYVRLGGCVAFVAHATGRYVIRLVDINMLAREMGASISLIRPQAATVLLQHPITRDLGPLPPMAWGVNVWSAVAVPVAKAGTLTYLSAIEQGKARVAFLDGKMALVGTRAVRSPVRSGPPQPFLPLLQATIDWLLQAGQ